MLSVRGRLVLPLVHRTVRPSTRRRSFQRCLAPLQLLIGRTATTRNFSQQNDNTETLLHRLKNTITDATSTAKVIAQEARGVDLTDYEATTLLSNFAKQKRLDDCVGLLRYCREHNVKPEISARISAFRTLCDAQEFQPALQLFKELSRDGVQLKPWMVGRALQAATKMKRPEVVTEICQMLVAKTKFKFSGGVHDMMKDVGESGDRLSEFALRSIVIFADRAGDAELAMDVVSSMKKEEMQVTTDVYASVMEACGKCDQWTDLVKVYEEMPEHLREKLYSRPLSLVVRAHTRSGREEMVERGLEIFYQHQKGKWSSFPCDASLEALLKTRQFEKLFDLAEEMKRNGVKWSAFTYKMVTMAYIESGSAGKAKQMLQVSAMDMENSGVECYRELVSYFSKERGDCLEACQAYADMMQNYADLDVSDWANALELALQLPDRATYWNFRKQLRLCGRSTEALIPSRLLLSIQDELPNQPVPLPRDDPEQIELKIQTDNTEAAQPLTSLNDVRESNDVEAKERKLSTLLSTFAKSKRVDESEELLRYCQAQDLSLDKSSQSAAFRSLCDAGRFEAALSLFETLSTGKFALPPWVYGRALEAAVKLNREELVLSVFRRLLNDGDAFKDHQVETSGKGVHAMMRVARDRGVKLSKLALRSLIIFADRSEDSELVQDIFSIMQSEGMNVSLDVYGSVLNAYGASERWGDVLTLYESMPENMRSKLHGTSLSWVVTATSRTEGKELTLQRGSSGTQVKRPPTDRPARVSDVLLVRERFEAIRNNGGVGLTEHTASTLLGTMAKHKRVYDCAEVLRYSEKQNVSLKPFAALAAFNLFCEAEEFSLALHAFENMYEGTYTQKPWVFGWAMDAATKLDRQDWAASIFQRLLAPEGAKKDINAAEMFQVQPSEHGVYGMLFDAHDRGVHVSKFAFEALLSFADKSSQSDLALDALSMMQDEGMKPSSDSYAMVLIACGKNEQWGEAIHVFEDMPKSLESELSSAALGTVVMAHTRSGDEGLTVRGLELFGDHKAKWSTFACNAALDALLQIQRLDDLLTLADDMKHQQVKWSSFTYSLVTLGHIRCGSMEKARRMLHDNAKRMQNDSVPCYQELIEHHAKTLGDTIEAVQLCEEMMQNNWKLSFSNWHTALELSLELPDRASYWRIRKQFWLRGESSEQRIPSHLLLSERETPRAQGLSFERQESLQTVHDTPAIPADVSLALEVFDDIWKAGGSGLTVNVATKLLVAMAQYQRIDDCVEMLDYFKEHRVTPKPFARLAAFRALCAANEDDQALELVEAMLSDDVILHARDCPVAVDTAMKMKRPELVTKIIDHMRAQDTRLSPKDYERIWRKYGLVEEWAPTVDMLSAIVDGERRHSQRSQQYWS
ncbi:hypothetical protein PRIC2_009822 [Phytophthora ramorum]